MAVKTLTTGISRDAITQYEVTQIIIDLVGIGQVSWTLVLLDAAGNPVDRITKARSFADLGIPAIATDTLESAVIAFEKAEGTIN